MIPRKWIRWSGIAFAVCLFLDIKAIGAGLPSVSDASRDQLESVEEDSEYEMPIEETDPSEREKAEVQQDREAGGAHWRFETINGPVHVWRPHGYLSHNAGVVVYIHGYYNNVDECWREHQLALQFARSSRNALFVVPEAPVYNEEAVRWEDFGALLDQVSQKTRMRIPTGPLVVMAHSGAIRTVRLWMQFETIDELILLDAMYAYDDEIRDWLGAKGHQEVRLVMVGCETTERSERFAEYFSTIVRRYESPKLFGDLSYKERQARILFIVANEGHMEVVTQGRLMPLLLKRTALAGL